MVSFIQNFVSASLFLWVSSDIIKLCATVAPSEQNGHLTLVVSVVRLAPEVVLLMKSQHASGKSFKVRPKCDKSEGSLILLGSVGFLEPEDGFMDESGTCCCQNI